MKLICNKSNPPLGGLLAASYINSMKNNMIQIEWSSENAVEGSNEKIICNSTNDMLRALIKSSNENTLYGSTVLEKTQIDHFLCLSIGPLINYKEFLSTINNLNKILAPATYLVGKSVTIADFAVFAALYVNNLWEGAVATKKVPTNVLRWYKFIESFDCIQNMISNIPAESRVNIMKKIDVEEKIDTKGVTSTAQGGKFVDLPGAEMGKVIVRFPPEASGYLHIGHAKAALLNQYYQEAFEGKLVMRFDDTNPAKENTHFEEVILEDVAMLKIKPDRFTYTSDYFDLMLNLCEKMLKEGKAYVDDTDPEVMKQEREQKVESSNRNNDFAKNLKMWEEMKKGTEYGQKCCVRAKIDMQSLNGCMRDPTIYRCKNETHPRTGSKYKVYPTYDFACPIVDSIEDVTHVLRTMEYHDRDPQFYWFIDVLGLRKPHIWEYSRLSMTNTVLSKRKLTYFVEQGLVDGWDDPRMPTVRGVLRRGMTVDGLREFIIAQGSSRSVVFMEWDKIWAINKKVIDPISPRYTVVDFDKNVPVNVKNVKEECLTAAKHPKNTNLGTKNVWVGPKVLIDQADAEALKEGENATFINWGNILIKKINRTNGKVTSIDAEPNLDDKDYKKTLKLTFLCETEKAKFTPTWCVYFDHLISKPLLGKDEDFKQFIATDTRRELQVLGDPELRNLKQGDIIQIQRRGFFRVDVAYSPASLFSGKDQPVILFYIPDGHTKENPMSVFTAKQENKTKKEEKTTKKNTSPSKDSVTEINKKIINQGNTVRDLKAKKAAKNEIDAAVKVLLDLKAEYKKVSGTEWKPGCVPSTEESKSNTKSAASVNEEIVQQGNIVRDLKAKKAAKNEIDGAVKILLDLKAEYKKVSGTEWKPGCVPSTEESKSNTKSAASLNEEIVQQGNIVRDLKAKKTAKNEIDAAVKVLLDLKAEYKKISGSEWKPGCVPPIEESKSNLKSAASINEEIVKQGNIVRDLKAKKATKNEIDAAVKVLLDLKAEYKKVSGTEWKPGCVPPTEESKSNTKSAASVNEEIVKQGNIVRDLKAKKAAKNEIDAAVKILLDLKAEYLKISGSEWKPGSVPSTEESKSNLKSAASVNEEIVQQGNIVRDLKAKKALKNEIDGAVKILLDLKAEYKKVSGTEWKPGCVPPKDHGVKIEDSTKKSVKMETKSDKKSEKQVASKNKPVKEKKPQIEESGAKKQTRLGLEAKKEENLANWYSQVITKGELIEYYDVSGCYIYRPWSFSIWEFLKNWFDGEIKKLDVQNCYFPIFVSKSVLEREKDHIADFAPEVAWVTKSGDSDMAEHIAIRPTSETVMYPAYAKWIQSYRDLPIKLNQWNNVVRWEFKHPQPFLRTREFLWQEGHTAYASKEDAEKEVKVILDLYAQLYSDLLAVPTVKGRKTEKEKFAGGDYTLTIEAFVSASGRAIQAATSHHLGQNFSKMFDIVYEDPETQEKKFVYQNSWGCTTRSIGVMIMVHGDNQGLVIPPKVCSVQVVIVPCGVTVNLSEEDRDKLQSSCDALESLIKNAGIRVKGDYRSNYSPGWKFNHWELKGVPIRIELGPKDIEKQQFVAVRRDTGEKLTLPINEAKTKIPALLNEIHNNLLQKATDDLKSHIITLKDWSKFTINLDKKNIILAPFCGEINCEDKIKADSTRDDGEAAEPGAPSMGAKSLCIPLDQPGPILEEDKCINPNCTNKPKFYTLFGRSY